MSLKFKEGDEVRTIRPEQKDKDYDLCAPMLPLGSIGRVVFIDKTDTDMPYRVLFPDGDTFWYKESWLELYASLDSAEPAHMARKYRAGDFVRTTAEADEHEVATFPIGTVVRVIGASVDDACYMVEDANGEPLVYREEALEPIPMVRATSEPARTEPTTIKDSGARRTFSSGAERDIQEGKGRLDLLPACAILRVARHFERGARKYSERNWEKGIPVHSYIDSALRHLMNYLDGQTDEDHLCAAAWNLLCAMWTEEKRPDLQDIPARLKEEAAR